MSTKSVSHTNTSGTIARLADGTVATNRALYPQPWAQRLAVVNALFASCGVDKRVEIELRSGRVVVGELVTAAYSAVGTTRDVLVIREADQLVPTIHSLATVRSISELTTSEYVQRVMSMSETS